MINYELCEVVFLILTYKFYRGYFFFFQAEDGIRDHCVTGVQTCALPISFVAVVFVAWSKSQHVASEQVNVVCAEQSSKATCKIGRASCRERV